MKQAARNASSRVGGNGVVAAGCLALALVLVAGLIVAVW